MSSTAEELACAAPRRAAPRGYGVFVHREQHKQRREQVDRAEQATAASAGAPSTTESTAHAGAPAHPRPCGAAVRRRPPPPPRRVSGGGAAGGRRRGAVPAVRVGQHQVLLLQQLQPRAAAPPVQGLPPLLDQGRTPPHNVPVGGACRKTKRPAADASGIHGARRDGKAPRHGCAGAATSSSSSPAADGDAISRIAVAQASSAFCVVTEPSGATSRSAAAGDAGALPLVPPPAPMFTDQAAVFASLFSPPRPLPAFGYSAPQEPEEEHVAGSHAAEQQAPASSAAAGEGMVPFAARSDGALAAGASSDWLTAASDDGGIFGLSGGIAGDASLLAYWNTGSWTNTDTAVYLP